MTLKLEILAYDIEMFGGILPLNPPHRVHTTTSYRKTGQPSAFVLLRLNLLSRGHCSCWTGLRASALGSDDAL